MFLNSNTSLSMYLFCNSRIYVITLYSGHVCVYYASMLQCWHLIWILVRTDNPHLGVGCHTDEKVPGLKFLTASHSQVRFDVSDKVFVLKSCWQIRRQPLSAMYPRNTVMILIFPWRLHQSSFICFLLEVLHAPLTHQVACLHDVHPRWPH
jgi:hypothetical protein